MAVYIHDIIKLRKAWPHWCVIKDPATEMWDWLYNDLHHNGFFCDWLYQQHKIEAEGLWIGFKNKEDYVQFFLIWG